ncbi:SART-1 family-domain-containing protein [Pisolithus marmoratus]|nr:SART-1 family-domain-containing protein [Pisolithus marmoratus]
MSMEESISLEETNRIRISFGLKPLTEDSAPADDADKQAEQNYAKHREREAKEREAKKIYDRIAKVRNKRELNSSLSGATLGDPDGDTEDTLKWIKKAKKREKELAKRRQQELENMDKAFQGEEYTEKDLVGLKVDHDLEELAEGDAHVLTLKDSRILDNEEDVLQNVNLAEEERMRKNMELKIKRRDYTGYDDDEFIAGKQGMKRSILAKYDEELEGSRETGFRLGSSVTPTQVAEMAEADEGLVKVNRTLLSIDYTKNLETSDYLREGDVGFKKPKTKKKRSARRAAIDGDDGANAEDKNQMEVDQKPLVPRPRELDANFVDDDELQVALARSRRAKIHKPKTLTPQEVARKLAEQQSREQSVHLDAMQTDGLDGDRADTGLVFDDTSEFVRGISYTSAPVKTEQGGPSTGPSVDQRPPSRQASATPGDQTIHELEAGEVVMKEEDEDEDGEAMLEAVEAAIKATEAEERAAAERGVNLEVGTAGENTYSSGMAGTLALLRQQGLLAEPTADLSQREKVQRQRDLWLAEHRRRQAQRELERLQSRGGNKDQATREYENRLREQQESRANLEFFKDYKPDVNIVYYDEFGRALTPKEAWKALSHKFHGKGSGKMKTEKRLKRIAEEKKKEAMASGDTPLSMNRAFQIRQEKTGQAHFVLSVGNRGAVPQASEFLEPPPLSKGKTEKAKNKKKDGVKSSSIQTQDDKALITLPAPQVSVNGATSIDGMSPAPSGFSSVGPRYDSGSPAPSARPGFSRISSTVDSPSHSHGTTPASGERTKVVFGFGSKRKAVEDGVDTPPAKRR